MLQENYLIEAFKSLDSLTEETFSTDKQGIIELKDFVEKDAETDVPVEVIDTEAKTVEDLEDDYTGKIILDCNVCHSKVYKDEDAIVIDEDTQDANIDEECPYCFSTDGYKIIGKVVEYCPHCHEEETISINEAKSTVKNWKEAYAMYDKIYNDIMEKHAKDANPEGHRDEILQEINRAIDKLYHENEDDRNFDKAYDKWMFDNNYLEDEKKDFVESLRKTIRNLREAEMSGKDKKNSKILRNIYKKTQAGRNTKLKEDFDDIDYDSAFNEIIDYLNEYSYSADDDVNLVMDEIASNLFDVEEYSELPSTLQLAVTDAVEEYFDGLNESIKEDLGTEIDKYQKWVDYDMKRYGKISKQTSRELEEAGLEVVKDKYGDYEVIAKSVKESFEKVEIETDTDKILVTSEPKEEVVEVEEDKDTEEVIAPLTDEEKDEIVADDEEVEVDEFSEEDFDELSECYLKRVYENVESYKTTAVKSSNGKIKVEGIISFKSGKNKPTSFIFESIPGTRNFVGKNEDLTRGSKVFKLTTSVSNKKLISESFTYNYKTKDTNGKSKRLYGRVVKAG